MGLLSKDLNNILHSYLGVIVVVVGQGVALDNRHILKNSIWLAETKDLLGLMAFIKWSIPKKEAFRDCANLKYIIGIPPTLGTDMSYMFYNATSFNQPLEQWDVSNVIYMRCMFCKTSSFNQPLEQWDVSSVSDMSWMFYIASSFNQPLGQWNVYNVIDMRCMFYDASSFNQPLDQWDVSNVNNMGYMFCGASSFNQPVGQWNVSSVIDMNSDMFWGANPLFKIPAWYNE